MATLTVTSVERHVAEFPPADLFVGRRCIGHLSGPGQRIRCELIPGVHTVALVESDHDELKPTQGDQELGRFELVVHADTVDAPTNLWLDRFVASRWQVGRYGFVNLECRYTADETYDGGEIPAYYLLRLDRP